jgi:general secretion pathway protein G
MKTKEKIRKNGFTLIELVIVIAVLGILAGLAIPRFLDSRAQAEGAKMLGDLRTIDSAISIYQARNGSYPENLDVLVTENYLAAIPSSPTGAMLITTNKGSEKSYTAVDTAYKLSDTRATYSSSELNKGTVEQYLEGGNSEMTNPSPSTVGNWEGKDYNLGDRVIGSDGVIYENMNTKFDSNTDPGISGYNFYAWKAVGTTDGKAIEITDGDKLTGMAFDKGITVLYNGNYYTCNGNVDGTGGAFNKGDGYDGSHYKNNGVKFDAANTSNWTKVDK